MQKGTVLMCLRFEQEMENCPLCVIICYRL